MINIRGFLKEIWEKFHVRTYCLADNFIKLINKFSPPKKFQFWFWLNCVAPCRWRALYQNHRTSWNLLGPTCVCFKQLLLWLVNWHTHSTHWNGLHIIKWMFQYSVSVITMTTFCCVIVCFRHDDNITFFWNSRIIEQASFYSISTAIEYFDDCNLKSSFQIFLFHLNKITFNQCSNLTREWIFQQSRWFGLHRNLLYWHIPCFWQKNGRL